MVEIHKNDKADMSILYKNLFDVVKFGIEFVQFMQKSYSLCKKISLGIFCAIINLL